ncbi:uncharacterized protein SPPG_07725 [Spizellomyces punctatus DAOM BR117]|uniref:Uncharacterized protein n=1 Tax=Spizellomyces punctatus (strain DAOM BR117) TaxID=645134 RepID=A0A0L0H6N4_SPIPD|nr:uncharacterized protein SPPG_07725 [Spizellomyces punctatus DAOM BR117]KNC96897.1 hypothetical protein SPPG_07725 [Spizellomyces punctatus DAOM BR117]|eukprot:XP_016604937.1 hypothetical protein SPPG_07725 [Spizellomyces punctatus DAOM BR117]
MSIKSVDVGILRNSAEFVQLRKECASWAIVAGAAGGVAGYGLGRLAVPRSSVLGIASTLVGAAVASTIVYNNLENKRLNALRVRKVAEHYHYMRPLLAPTVVEQGVEI